MYARPADLPVVNLEGYAVAPNSTCVNGVKDVVWSDDGTSDPNHLGHALFSGTLPCALDLPAQGANGNGSDQDNGEGNGQDQDNGQGQSNGSSNGADRGNGASNLARAGGPAALAGLGALALIGAGTVLVRRFR